MSSWRGATRADDLRNYWPREVPSLTYGREQFRFTLIRRRRRLPSLRLDGLITHANWQRDGTNRTAEINLQWSSTTPVAGLVLANDEVLCEVDVQGSGRWRPVWLLATLKPSIDEETGVISMALAGSLRPIVREKQAWKFRRDNRHQRGWTADQITRAVCKELGVEVLEVPKGTHRIAKLIEHKASGVDVIVRAWKQERAATGRQFDVDISTGALRVTEVRTPQHMLLLRDHILSAVVNGAQGAAVTRIKATATVKPRGAAKSIKLHATVVDRRREAIFGQVTRDMAAPRGVDTLAELRTWARRQLAEAARPSGTVALSVPGMPMLDRGDAVKIRLPLSGVQSIAYVTSARHDLSAGSYITQIEVGFRDPVADVRRARVAKMKARERARRRGRVSTTAAPKPARHRIRSDS